MAHLFLLLSHQNDFFSAWTILQRFIKSSYRPIPVEHMMMKNILNFKGFYVLGGEPGRGEFQLRGGRA